MRKWNDHLCKESKITPTVEIEVNKSRHTVQWLEEKMILLLWNLINLDADNPENWASGHHFTELIFFQNANIPR